MEPMREVKMIPFREGCEDYAVFKLRIWDGGEPTRPGASQWKIRYELEGNGRTVFEGDDFGCSPLHAIESDDCLRSLLGFLTLRPCDTDEDYFEDYTPGQLDFCDRYAETLATWADEEDPCPWDE